MIKFSRKIKLVDIPNNEKLKIHSKPIPLSGGPSLVISVFVGFLIFHLLKQISISSFEHSTIFIVLGALIVFLIGLADDFSKLNQITRLGIFFISASLALFRLYTQPFDLLILGMAAILIVIEIIAINMIDGMDGLCGSYFFISLVGFYFITSSPHVKLLIIILIISIVAFLVFNLPPAKIFLGDSGSTLIGFLICYLLIFNLKIDSSATGIISNLLIATWPLIDFASAIFRRLKSHRPIMEGDRDHIYDKLLRKFSTKQTLGILSGFQAIIVTIAVLINKFA